MTGIEKAGVFIIAISLMTYSWGLYWEISAIRLLSSFAIGVGIGFVLFDKKK